MIRFIQLTCVLSMLFMACQGTEKQAQNSAQQENNTQAFADIQGYWPAFQQALNGSKEDILPFVLLPLELEEPELLLGDASLASLNKDNFFNHYEQLFDVASKEKIAATKVAELEKNGETYELFVFSVQGEGADKEESATIYRFKQVEGKFQLISLGSL